MHILVTGVAGFIGFSLAKKLIKNFKVIGIDNLNSYYSVKLKKKRLSQLKDNNFKFYKFDIQKKNKLLSVFKKHKITHVIHLAAQAGIRYSITNPESYLRSNLIGTFSILECCKIYKVKNLLIASSSSVYGDTKSKNFLEEVSTDNPLQFYAATKKSNEVMAYSYACLYKIPTICMRIFTVYGPWGRPDMAIYKFTKNIFENKVINIFNNGNHSRDFTYIDDAVSMIMGLLKKPPKIEKIYKGKFSIKEKRSPYKIFNITSGQNIKITKCLNQIEKGVGKKARVKYLTRQAGDMITTKGSQKKIKRYIRIKKKTSFKDGIYKFILWYREYFKK